MAVAIHIKEAKPEIETHPVTAEANINKNVQYSLKSNKHFCVFYSLNHFALFLH